MIPCAVLQGLIVNLRMNTFIQASKIFITSLKNIPNGNTCSITSFFRVLHTGNCLEKTWEWKRSYCLVLCTHNVIPRRGDKMEVRFQEVPVLYMLMRGSPMVPFRFLVLNNIWISRNSCERKIVPHCRLLMALLKKYGAIGPGEKSSYKRFNPFDIQHLGSGWEYKESERYHKLKTDGRWWRVLKADARPLRPGEADEPEVSEEEDSGDDDYREDTFTVDVPMGGAGPSGSIHGAGV
ncbi:hypothetical protein HanPI659440_Chr02g0044981 [Helianthus annuus]|nr:hypothetical protein HanPI659440_Chr02g0044981 [Helianthus annuus]